MYMQAPAGLNDIHRPTQVYAGRPMIMQARPGFCRPARLLNHRPCRPTLAVASKIHTGPLRNTGHFSLSVIQLTIPLASSLVAEPSSNDDAPSLRKEVMSVPSPVDVKIHLDSYWGSATHLQVRIGIRIKTPYSSSV